VIRFSVDSQVLEGNLLGDPTQRAMDVYVPAGHTGRGLPLLVDVVGFTAGGLAHTNWKNFGENVPERLDRLIGSGAMPPVVVAFPDCFTALGGNQYINSAAMGRWADFLLEEAVPEVDRQLYEVVISANSPLIGDTLKSAGFRRRYDAAVIATPAPTHIPIATRLAARAATTGRVIVRHRGLDRDQIAEVARADVTVLDQVVADALRAGANIVPLDASGPVDALRRTALDAVEARLAFALDCTS
jgi:hypothetical protein